jgi:hypothetical protein
MTIRDLLNSLDSLVVDTKEEVLDFNLNNLFELILLSLWMFFIVKILSSLLEKIIKIKISDKIKARVTITLVLAIFAHDHVQKFLPEYSMILIGLLIIAIQIRLTNVIPRIVTKNLRKNKI